MIEIELGLGLETTSEGVRMHGALAVLGREIELEKREAERVGGSQGEFSHRERTHGSVRTSRFQRKEARNGLGDLTMPRVIAADPPYRGGLVLLLLPPVVIIVTRLGPMWFSTMKVSAAGIR